MVHEFSNMTEEEDDGAKVVDVLPVDELLDRVILGRIQILAVKRSFLYLATVLLFCVVLTQQRSLSDNFELEHSIEVNELSDDNSRLSCTH